VYVCTSEEINKKELRKIDYPDKNDGHSIIEDNLTEDQCTEMNIDIEIIKDSQNSHCNKQSTVRFDSTAVLTPWRTSSES